MVGTSVWGQRPRSEIRVSSTFAALAISSQMEARGTGTAVGANCVLACVLAKAARGRPAFIHVCGQTAEGKVGSPEKGWR